MGVWYARVEAQVRCVTGAARAICELLVIFEKQFKMVRG